MELKVPKLRKATFEVPLLSVTARSNEVEYGVSFEYEAFEGIALAGSIWGD